MFRIIITVIFLIAIAVLIVMNIGSTADVNAFGWKIEQLSVTVVAIVSFVAGVLYSFVFYLLSYLERGRRVRLEKRKKKLKDQAAELKTREREADSLAEESKEQLETVRKIQGPSSSTEAGAGGFLSGLFGRGKAQDAVVAEPAAPNTTDPQKRKKRK
jgi:cell shape-determining protein MreC